MKKTACLILICLFMLLSLSAETAFDTENIPVTFVSKATYGTNRTIRFFDFKNDEARFSSFSISNLLKQESVEEKIGHIQIETTGSTGFTPRITVTASEFFMKDDSVSPARYYVLPAKYLIDCTSITGILNMEDLDDETKPYIGAIDLSQPKVAESPAVEEKSLNISAPQLKSPATYKLPVSVRVNRTDVLEFSDVDKLYHNRGEVPPGSYTSYVTVTYWEVV